MSVCCTPDCFSGRLPTRHYFGPSNYSSVEFFSEDAALKVVTASAIPDLNCCFFKTHDPHYRQITFVSSRDQALSNQPLTKSMRQQQQTTALGAGTAACMYTIVFLVSSVGKKSKQSTPLRVT